MITIELSGKSSAAWSCPNTDGGAPDVDDQQSKQLGSFAAFDKNADGIVTAATVPKNNNDTFDKLQAHTNSQDRRNPHASQPEPTLSQFEIFKAKLANDSANAANNATAAVTTPTKPKHSRAKAHSNTKAPSKPAPSKLIQKQPAVSSRVRRMAAAVHADIGKTTKP